MRLMQGHVRHQPQPSDLATFEHLDSRYSPERGRHSGERRVVLSHHACNHAYNIVTEKQVGIEELRRRSECGRIRQRNRNTAPVYKNMNCDPQS